MRGRLAFVVMSIGSCLSACVGGTDAAPALQVSEYPSGPVEDSQGALWFPTAFDGAMRYDGRNFVAFTTAQGLPSDTIRDILVDADGALWFATGGGLCRYDGASFSSLLDYADGVAAGGLGAHGGHLDLWDVHRDRRGDLWIASLGGVFRLEGARFRRFPLTAQATAHRAEFTPDMVYCVFEDRDGALWFGTDGVGAVRWDGETQRAFTTADGLCSNHVCRIVQGPRGDFWFGTSDGGVSHYDGERFSTHLRNDTFSEHNGWGRFLGILVDRTGAIWLGRASPGGGVYRYDGQRFDYLSTGHGLGDGGVIGLGEDRRGRIWVGSTSGVFCFDGTRFVNVTREPPTRI